MELERVMYVNLVDDGVWKSTGRSAVQKPVIQEYTSKSFAMATQNMEKLNGESRNGSSGGNSNVRKGNNDGAVRKFLPWRYENLNNEDSKHIKPTPDF